jgi:O-antigen/teichoic acid export membrane protein
MITQRVVSGFAQLLASLVSKRAYLQTTLIYLLERLFSIAISFVVYTALARTYGPALIGTYSYVQTVMLFAVPFLATGSEGIVIRELVRLKRPQNEVMGSSFVMLSLTGLTMTLIPLLGIWIFQGDEKSLVTMALFTAFGFLPTGFLVAEQSLKAKQRALPIFIARVGSSFACASVKLYLIYFRYPIESIVLVTAIESFILTIVLLYFYARDGKIRDWKFNAAYAKEIFNQCFPGMIASITVMLFFRANHILLVYLLGYEAVGQYAVAFQTSQLFLVLPHVFFAAIYPRLVYLHTHDPARYRTVLNVCYFGFTGLGYLILIFCVLFARPIFHFVFGDRYDTASQIIVVLAIANVFNFSGAVRGRAIDISNSTHYHVWCAAIGLMIVIPASWFVIPVYGALGSAWCIAFALFISGMVTSFFLPAVRDDARVQLKSLFLIPSFKISEI